MPDPYAQAIAEANERSVRESAPAVVVRDLELTYEIYADNQRPTLRRLIARRFKPRPATEVEAVRGVSFTLHRGEALGLIGPNGSGKSTMLRTVAGLLPPTAGEVYASETPVLLGVSAALHPELSGRRNVFLGGTAMGMSRAELEERFDEIVAFAELEEFIDMPMRAYSSGMQARLAFSIATATTPDILLIDEALSVGDESFKRRSEQRMKQLLGEAGAIILVSHSLGSIKDICSRVMWLQKGQLVMDGDPEEVIAAYQESVRGDGRAEDRGPEEPSRTTPPTEAGPPDIPPNP